jgi:threonine/homoserine/homoserine lactone efflux protein
MTVTLEQLALFAVAFAAVIATPGPMAAAISARAMTFGFASGAAMAFGSVVGDLFFSLTAMFGLAALSTWFDAALPVLKWIGAAWLILLGLKLIFGPTPCAAAVPPRDSPARAFLAAAAVGLGNPKAALFYLAVFPGFFDVTRLTGADAAAILSVVLPILVLGNLAWAAAAARARRLLTSARALRNARRASGGVLAAAGAAVAAA